MRSRSLLVVVAVWIAGFAAVRCGDSGAGPDGGGDASGDATVDQLVPDAADAGGDASQLPDGAKACSTLFAAPEDLPLGSALSHLTSGDFDGDGKRDLVVVQIDGIHFYPGKGNGTFGARVDSPVPATPTAVATADLDGNGKLDLVLASDTELTVMLGNGDGTFTQKAQYAASNLRELAIADFDGDKKLDVAVAIYNGSPGLALFPGNGDGTLASPKIASALYAVASIDDGDFNGDGVPDIAGPTETFLMQPDAGAFANATVLPTAVYGAGDWAARVGDFDHDGKLDVAIATPNLQIFYGKGDGSFRPVIPIHSSTATSSALAVADLNGDLATDVVAVGNRVNAPAQADLALSEADGGTGFVRSYSAPYFATSALLADFDGDGRMDLASSGEDEAALLLGAAGGTFRTNEVDAGDDPQIAVAADVDGDKVLDLVVGSPQRLGFWTMKGAGNGAFGAPVVAASSTSSYVNGLCVGDFKEDTIPDVVTIGSSAVKLYAGLGNGQFAAPTTPRAVQSGVPTIACGDVDGDKHLDVVVGDYGSSVVLLGKGDGTFTTSPLPLTSITPLALGDFNHDGHVDLATGYTSPQLNGSAIVLFGPLTGLPDGGFPPQTGVFLPSRPPTSFAVADLNADKIDDLVVGNSSGGPGKVDVVLGAADGGITTTTTFATGDMPFGVSLADVDGDGRLDILTADELSNSLGVLLGNGDGTFRAARRYRSGLLPMSVTSGDFDGDGKPDVAVVNATSSTISVFLSGSCL